MELTDVKITPLIDTLRLQKIDDNEYFSAKYSGYISNSRLSLIDPKEGGSPEAFFEGLSKHNKYSDALIFGSAVHELVLQPEYFHLCTSVDRPSSKAGFMADYLYPFYLKNLSDEKFRDVLLDASNKIGYYKGKFDKDKQEALIAKCTPYWESRQKYESQDLHSTPIYLDAKSRDRVIQCVSALDNNQTIQGLLHPSGLITDPISENEKAILLDVKVSVGNLDPFIFRIKAKVDNYTVEYDLNRIVVNDVKTIGKVLSEFSNNFNRFHYYRELSLYSWLMSLVATYKYKMSNCIVMSNCLVVSTIPKYYTKVFTLSKCDFKKGWEEFKYLLKLAAYYYSKGYRFT